jgi:hypothetical protein
MEFTKLKNSKRLVILLSFILSFNVLASTDWVKDYKSYLPSEMQDSTLIDDVKQNVDKFDELDLFNEQAGYQMKMIGHKFALVIDPKGAPLAVFDLSMNHLTWKELALGTLSFGDYSLLQLWKMWKKAKKSANNGNNLLNNDQIDIKPEKRDINDLKKLGLKYFGNLRFTKEWAKRNGFSTKVEDGKAGVPFRFASFKLSDLAFEAEEIKRKFLAPFAMMAETMYPNKVWNQNSLLEWVGEFEFAYNKENPGYTLKWDRSQRIQEETPQLPSAIVNYMYPIQNVIMKINYFRMQQYGELFIGLFGSYGMVVDYFMSRLVWNLIERLDYHEKQLLGVLEATSRFEFESELPDKFLETTTNIIYTNYFTSTGDGLLGNGRLIRRRERYNNDVNNETIVNKLSSMAEKEKMSLNQLAGGKFIVARSNKKEDEGKLLGIVNGAIDPYWLINIPSVHFRADKPVWKIVERYLVDTVAYLTRVLIPNNFYFGMWNIAIGIRIQPDQKDLYVKARSIKETSMEGELVSLLEQGIRGNIDLAMTRQELVDTRKILHSTYINPFKLSLKDEESVIKKNYKVLKRAVEGETQYLLQDKKNFVPMFY